MAYDPNNLSALSYANGFTGWHYRTPDTVADCVQPGYFDGAANMLRVGDQFILDCGDRHEFAVAFVTRNREGRVHIRAATSVVGAE